MLTPFGLIRKFGKFIRGGSTPFEILLACVLGMMAGMVPGFNVTLVIGILLIVLLNVNLGLAILSLIIGKVLSLILAPLTFRIGFFIIHGMGLEGLFRWAGDTPVIALMNLHYYCLIGGQLAGLGLGLVWGVFMARLITGIRRRLIAAGDKHAFLQVLTKNPFYRFFMWLLFGKRRGTMADILEAKSRVFRKAGVIVTVVLAVILIGAPLVLVDYILAGKIAEGLTDANGAEVNVGKASLSVFTGKVTLEDVQVTDRGKPTHNLVQADRLTGDLSILDLLAKRLVVDSIVVDKPQTDIQRVSPGKVLPKAEPVQPPTAEDLGRVLDDYLGDPEKYEKYWEYLKRIRQYLEDYKKRQEAKETEDQGYMAELGKNKGYFELSAEELLNKHPRVVIRKLIINRIRVGGEKVYRLEGYDLSSDPALNPNAMKIHFGDLTQTADGKEQFATVRKLFIDFGFGLPEPKHEVDALFTGLDVPELSSLVPVDVSEGKASVLASGTFSADELLLPFELKVINMKAQAAGGRSVLGLPPEASRKIFDGLQNFTLVGGLRGTIDKPRPVIDEQGTLSMLKKGLVGTAKAVLMPQIDALLKDSPIKLPGVGDILDDPAGGIRDILNGGRGNDQNQPEQPTTQPEPGGGILDRILGS